MSVESNGGDETIGVSGSGSFIQSGGTNTVSTSTELYIARGNGSSGTYNLSGGLLSGTVSVGGNGQGAFTQSGGMNNTGNLYIPGDGLAGGTYYLTGGLLSKSEESVSEQGAFIQSGGTNDATSLYVSYYTASYNLTGGLLLTGSGISENVGTYHEQPVSGSFTQSGGTNSMGGLAVGGFQSSRGNYNLSGGLLIAGTGAIEYVGYEGPGAFTQSGGTNSVPTIYLGYQFSGGTYSLNSGLLITTAISNTSLDGVFNFGGGTLEASGPLSTNSPMLLTGDDGNATVDSAGYAVVFSGRLSGSGGLTKTDSGVLILSGSNSYSGGTDVSAGTLELLSGSALASGTSLIVGAEAVEILSGAIAPKAATAVPEPRTLVLLALVGLVAVGVARRRGATAAFWAALGLAAILMYPSAARADTYWNAALSDWSTATSWTDGLPNSSTDAYFYNGGVATVSQTGEVCGNLYLGSPTLSGVIALQGGGLAVNGNAQIGYSGTGVFTQSGGTQTISKALFVGSELGSSGSYSLNAGLLSLQSNESVGYSGTGAFSQTGGTNTINNNNNHNTLNLGYNPGSIGTYSLSGSGKLSAANEFLGYWGMGNFVQAGGTNIVSGSNLFIGGNAGSNGTYSLSGSGVLTAPIVYLGYAAGNGSIGMSGGSLTVSDSACVGYFGLGTVTQSGGTSSFGGNLPFGGNGGLLSGLQLQF